jgi:hypothetical protein
MIRGGANARNVVTNNTKGKDGKKHFRQRGATKGKQAPMDAARGEQRIEKARHELEEASKAIKQSRKKLSRAAHKLLLEGMEYDTHEQGENGTIATATHLLDDERLSIACDRRKYDHIDANTGLDASGNDTYTVHATVIENITCVKTQKKRVDKHGQFNVFKAGETYEPTLPYEREIKLDPGLHALIRGADQHIIETPRYFSVIFSKNASTDEIDRLITTYLKSQGLKHDRSAHPDARLHDFFVYQIKNMTHEKGTSIIWEPNSTIHRHKSSDYEVAVIEQKGMLQDPSFMEHAEYKLSVNRRLVLAGLGNMKGSKFVICEEIIIQLMKRHEDAIDEHIKFHPTDQALLITARPFQGHDTLNGNLNKTNIHFFGNNSFSVDMTSNPAMCRIDRAESAMVGFGWILKQLQNITAHNMQHTRKAEVFFRKFTEDSYWLTELNKHREKRHKEALVGDTSEDKVKLLRESFLGRQKAMEIVAVKDNAFPRTKLWYPAPSFSVIVVSPVENPTHNYIMVQTFPCTHEKSTIAHVYHRKAAMYTEGTPKGRVPSDDRLDNNRWGSPTTRRPRSPPAEGRRQTPTSRAESAFMPGISRLPEDLEFELQML